MLTCLKVYSSQRRMPPYKTAFRPSTSKLDVKLTRFRMQVVALTNRDSDQPHWITRDVFYSHFDQDDFRCRVVKNVEFTYRSDWFHTLANGTIGFYIPVVSAIGRRTDLIGTRHRLAVLLPHMTELPVAFAMGCHLTSKAREFLESIPKRPLHTLEPFWIPDFPIRDSLP